MKGQSLNLMRKALYESSEEMTANIILQKDRRIQELEARLERQVTDSNLLIRRMEGRIQEMRERMEELQRENISLRERLGQVGGLEAEAQKKLQQQFIAATKKWEKQCGVVKSWDDMGKMQKVAVQGGALQKLPKRLFQLNQLKYLYLGENKLKELPETLSSLKELQTLWLNNNQLAKLPQSLGNLRELTWLNLNNNQLTELPQSLGNLKELQRIWLGNNKLTKLPQSLGNLTKLELLAIEYNPLVSLPQTLSNLKQLTIVGIDVELVPLSDIFKTKPFSNFSKLQRLAIYYSKIDGQRQQKLKQEFQQRNVKLDLRKK